MNAPNEEIQLDSIRPKFAAVAFSLDRFSKFQPPKMFAASLILLMTGCPLCRRVMTVVRNGGWRVFPLRRILVRTLLIVFFCTGCILRECFL